MTWIWVAFYIYIKTIEIKQPKKATEQKKINNSNLNIYIINTKYCQVY